MFALHRVVGMRVRRLIAGRAFFAAPFALSLGAKAFVSVQLTPVGGQGGKQTTNKWAIRVQLTKPVTWVPLIWGVACGAAAAGTSCLMLLPFDSHWKCCVMAT